MKAVIFDMDGVIIDSEPLHQQVEAELLKELGGFITDADKESFVGTTDQHMWSTMKERFDLSETVEEMIERKKELFLSEVHAVPLVPGFKEVLEDLSNAGYLVALASSNNRRAVDQIIDQFDLASYLQVAMSGEDVVHGKPDPEIFLKTALVLGVEPEDCLVVEDARNGVLAAKAAGMKCIGLNNPNSGPQDLSAADLVIESYSGFDLETIKKLFG